MTLGEKLQHLRQLEGELRGLGRPMTKAEVLRALMARFFKVLPGYLVSDPEGYQAAIVSDVVTEPDALRSWLAARAEEVRDDLHLYHVLLKMSRHPDPRRLFDALEELVDAEQPASKRSA